MFTYEKIKLFYSSIYFPIFALNDLWPIFWPSYANTDLASTPMALYTIHARYYVKSGLTNVLKNANKTKNMHLFSIRIANYIFDTYPKMLRNIRNYWPLKHFALHSLSTIE